MNFLYFLLILAVWICSVYAAPASDPKHVDSAKQFTKEHIGIPVINKHNPTRTARQIGYGGASSGIGSQLQGISSGYGYGYNNAVGLGGVGQQAGTNLGLFPGMIG